MNINDLKTGFKKVSEAITKNKMYLVELDQRNGDGDLGISMSDGYIASYNYICECTETDIGRVLNKAADAFNEAAPSSLGTIIAFFFKGMAKSLKGKEEFTLSDLAQAMDSGLKNIYEKVGSKPGQKTIIDTLYPAIETLKNNVNNPDVWKEVAVAARNGSNSTANMKAVWGRAAYFAEESIGVIDGGSVAGAIMFEALAE